MLNTAPFPVDPTLTAIGIAYSNPAHTLIGDEVMPRAAQPVGTKAYKYNKYNLADGFTVPDTKVGRTGKPGKVTFDATEVAGACEDYGIESDIPQDDIIQGQKNGFDPRNNSTEYCAGIIKLDREVRVAAAAFNAANYAVGNKIALVGTSQFNDYVNSDPIGVISGALDSTTVYRPNIMTLGALVWTKLRGHPAIVKAVNSNSGDKGLVSRRAVADLFELEDLLVGSSFLNTTRKGQAPNLSRVWGKHIQLQYRDKQFTNNHGITWGGTFQYGQPVAGSRPNPDVGLRGGETVRFGETLDEKIIAADVAFFIENAIQ